MTEYKIITQTASADTTQLTFTDELITNNSLIDFYYTDNTVYTESVSQSGTSVYLTISEHTNTVGVACVINNVTSYEPFDDTEIQNALSDLRESIQTIESNIETIDGILSDHTSVLSSHSSEIINLQNNKQDELTPGDNITIVNNVISASGGGMVIDTTERVIGTLFGKPLYAKCVPSTIGIGTSATNLSSVLPTEQSELEIMFDCKFLKLYTSTSAWSIRHVDVYLSDNVYVGKAYDSTGASNYTEMYYYWEYTKRSD